MFREDGSFEGNYGSTSSHFDARAPHPHIQRLATYAIKTPVQHQPARAWSTGLPTMMIVSESIGGKPRVR